MTNAHLLAAAKAHIAVQTVLRSLAITPGLGIFIGAGTDAFDRLIEAAAAADGVELNSPDDAATYWLRTAARIKSGGR